eukprot:4112035-Alexandrium_andersonii.AAC.1
MIRVRHDYARGPERCSCSIGSAVVAHGATGGAGGMSVVDHADGRCSAHTHTHNYGSRQPLG